MSTTLSCKDCIHHKVCKYYESAKKVFSIVPETIAKDCEDYLNLESFLSIKDKIT